MLWTVFSTWSSSKEWRATNSWSAVRFFVMRSETLFAGWVRLGSAKSLGTWLWRRSNTTAHMHFGHTSKYGSGKCIKIGRFMVGCWLSRGTVPTSRDGFHSRRSPGNSKSYKRSVGPPFKSLNMNLEPILIVRLTQLLFGVICIFRELHGLANFFSVGSCRRRCESSGWIGCKCELHGICGIESPVNLHCFYTRAHGFLSRWQL